MYIKQNDTEIDFLDISKRYTHINWNETVFFDIETTGFSAKNTKLYMIGVLYLHKETNTFHSTQWFLDDYKDESLLICEFINFVKQYNCLIHYNGQGFDIPYIEAKCKYYNIIFDFSAFKHIDLYKIASPLKNVFKTENLKQKTMELFFDVNRQDIFSGGDLISVYFDYMETKNEQSLTSLLLHNYEDITGMITLLNILSYSYIFEEEYDLKSLTVNSYTSPDSCQKKEAVFEFTLHTSVPKRISFGQQEFYVTAFANKLKIKIQIYTNELKFFYRNYKDYFYLPEEDISVHKSVAFYVDKNYRTKAKAANCYSKKTGQFLPQYDEIISPYFKIDYYDKKMYFEMTPEFMNNIEEIRNYINHVLSHLKG